ncbi:polymorphic toxin-type HINT domain-containing protein [Cellulomonas sp. NPDC057328]|uniref:polymorphic toxin-type HINT domain-containing protein n=1 Tax=Cellulomonas sp. NPDC057328 TaxID=3346101 RepID=UPI00362F6FCB
MATLTGHGAKDVVDLTLVGSGGGGGPPADTTITATDGHLFLTADGDWVPAGDLETGDQLVDRDGTPVTLAATNHRSETSTVHNLTVDTDHTYTVTTTDGTDVVTHNDDPRRKDLRDSISGATDDSCPRATPESDYTLRHRSERAGDVDRYTEGQATRDPFSHYEFMDDDEFLATINGVEEGRGSMSRGQARSSTGTTAGTNFDAGWPRGASHLRRPSTSGC